MCISWYTIKYFDDMHGAATRIGYIHFYIVRFYRIACTEMYFGECQQLMCVDITCKMKFKCDFFSKANIITIFHLKDCTYQVCH